VFDDLRSVVFIGGGEACVPVLGLEGCFTTVITFPVELTSGNFNQLVQIESSGEDAEQVSDHFEVIQV